MKTRSENRWDVEVHFHTGKPMIFRNVYPSFGETYVKVGTQTYNRSEVKEVKVLP